jgi:hypothetical protein
MFSEATFSDIAENRWPRGFDGSSTENGDGKYKRYVSQETIRPNIDPNRTSSQ